MFTPRQHFAILGRAPKLIHLVAKVCAAFPLAKYCWFQKLLKPYLRLGQGSRNPASPIRSTHPLYCPPFSPPTQWYFPGKPSIKLSIPLSAPTSVPLSPSTTAKSTLDGKAPAVINKSTSPPSTVPGQVKNLSLAASPPSAPRSVFSVVFSGRR